MCVSITALEDHVMMGLSVMGIYCICSIRRRSYYLFHRAILCSFYSRAATNWEWRLLNSVLSVKSFVVVRAFRKASFVKINKELQCDDLVFEQAFQLDQPPLCYKGYLHGTSNPFHRFLPMNSHDDRLPRLKKCKTSLNSVRCCTYRVYSFDIAIWDTRLVHVRMCYSNISHG